MWHRNNSDSLTAKRLQVLDYSCETQNMNRDALDVPTHGELKCFGTSNYAWTSNLASFEPKSDHLSN